RMEHFTTRADIEVFDCGAQLPNLGRATAHSSVGCETYLVCNRETPVKLRRFQTVHGTTICVDQLVNPDTVGFTPAGILNEGIVLHGRVATVSDSKPAQDLMRRFHSAIKKSFAKIKAFYVGPNARALWERGARLTISAQSPREFDLTVS